MGTGYRFGIEEELFLADATTRGTPRRTLKPFHAAVHAALPTVERELLQAQLEIACEPTTSFDEARAALGRLREALAGIGRAHGILVLASGTQPMARWRHQRRTDKPRYEAISAAMQMLAQRDMVCGMHVHVEVPDPSQRIALMRRLLPFMPVLLALSASSPFWQRRATGLAAYRLSVWGEMPHTGLPDLFADAAEYDRYVAAMTRCGAIEDASFLWWTLRPSIRFPTLELRVADSCTRLEDTLAIAALYRCLVRLLVRRPAINRDLTAVSRALAAENLWRAQRHGVEARLIDEQANAEMTLAAHLDRLLDWTADDARAFGCRAELDHARRIIVEGTSADRQRSLFDGQRGQEGTIGALQAVVEWIAAETAGEAR